VRSLNGNPDEYNLDDLGRLKVAAAVPTNEQALERIEAMQGYLDVAVVDTAHGNSIHASQTVSLIKESYPDLEVMAGNVSDGESAKVLVDAGADGVKVGQGPGSICSTRIEAGIGTPQITAIYECVKAIKGSGVPICADGGIVYRGDISKAIAAGASSVMMGRMLAGTDEAPGTTTLYQGVVLKDYRGMGSLAAFKDSEASRQRYGVDMSRGIPAPEGVEARVQCVGPAKDVVDLCVKDLKISMSYVGSPDIKTHRTRTRFNRITNAGMNESRPHDIMII
jgi:IMP dehydrogenase